MPSDLDALGIAEDVDQLAGVPTVGPAVIPAAYGIFRQTFEFVREGNSTV